VRSAAQATGLSKSTVARMFALFGIQPHRSKSFQLSTDPLFIDKVRDIVGLYLNPPDHAAVLCVDEKSQVQALERTQPVLPLGLGYIEGVTHTTFDTALRPCSQPLISPMAGSSLSVARVIAIRSSWASSAYRRQCADDTRCASRRRQLLYVAHKHPKVRAWLAARPRFHLRFTPTYASWLNQVERWFAASTNDNDSIDGRRAREMRGSRSA